MAVERRTPTTEFHRESIAAARRRAPADKLREGLSLFDRALRVMADGIRCERPDASPATVQQVLRERLRLARKLERR